MNTKLGMNLIFPLLAILIGFMGCTSTVPVESIFWEVDSNGFIQFCTNDPEYYNYYFYVWYEESYQTILDEVEIEVKKVSGYEWGGYGMVFCLQDENSFYVLLIDNTGYYAIYEKNYGSWIEHIEWTYSNKLHKGYDKINTLKVDYNDFQNFFTISFNGSYVNSFSDYSYNGGYSGCFVEIWGEEEESFPNNPVDIRFKLIQSSAVQPPVADAGYCLF